MTDEELVQDTLKAMGTEKWSQVVHDLQDSVVLHKALRRLLHIKEEQADEPIVVETKQ